MSFVDQTKEHFDQLKVQLFSGLKGTEQLSLNLNGENSLFVRLNNAKVRQNTSVEQNQLELVFQNKQRRLHLTTDLSLDPESDLRLCASLIERARKEIELLPEDPAISNFENKGSSHSRFDSNPLNFQEVMDCMDCKAEKANLTGLLAAGPQLRACSNSLGQEHWFSTESFFLDYSLFTTNAAGENKAVKGNYAGTDWSSTAFKDDLRSKSMQLQKLREPSRRLEAGPRRVYLAPEAFQEIIAMLNWNALSYGAYRRGNCPFAQLADKKKSLSPLFSLRENFGLGLTAPFNSLGEVPPTEIPMIQNGVLQNFLVSTRVANEFKVTANAAETSSWGHEYLRSAEILPGTLDESEIFSRLGNGLFLSHLHYCNWSDLPNARITGMTRYAALLVENGEPVAPIQDMRFDVSLYQILGPALEALSSHSSMIPSTDTYVRRALGGSKIPGALISEFQFTL